MWKKLLNKFSKKWHNSYNCKIKGGIKSEKQEEALKAAGFDSWASDYSKCCDYLESIGLLVDDGYKFGTGWLKRDIPAEDVAEIEKLLTEE